MRFGVLGPVTVWDGDGREIRVPEAKVRALLADLLTHEGRPVPADRLVDDLWGDALPGNPANALQAKVSQLRRALGRDRVVRQPAGYRLRLDLAGSAGPVRGSFDSVDFDSVDAADFERLAAQARRAGDPRERVALLTEALGLWRGPAYADFADEEFARAAVRRLEEQRLTVLEERAEARLAAGDHASLAGELAGLVSRHPLRERLRAVQMRALYAAGRQSEALESYRELRELLAEELGIDPGPELTALHGSVLRHDPTLTTPPLPVTPPTPPPALTTAAHPPAPTGAAQPPASTGPAWGPSLAGPAEAPSLAGPTRADGLPAPAPAQGPGPTAPAQGPSPNGAGRQPTLGALAEARDSFLGASVTAPAPDVRGAGGLAAALTPLIGRDEAAAEVVRLLGTSRLVTLAGTGGVGKTRLALECAARLSGAGAGAGLDGVWLVELAGDRAGDVAGLARLVAAALGLRDDAHPAPGDDAAARLAAALRGRRALLVLDNCEHVVEPAAELTGLLLRAAPGLRVLVTSQEPLALPGETVYLVEPLRDDDAVALFAERATASAPGFVLDEATREAVTEICRRLDGLPLALELAAARVRVLGVRELAARLTDRFRLLTQGRRGAPARQRTLRAMIDWSWELLGAPERAVLRRLAVHADGCDLAAAEAVCAGGEVGRDDVLDLLTRLVDRSLVAVAEGPRYRLLESVRAYALERLAEAEDPAAVRARHRRHYLALAERAEPLLRGPAQREWLRRLDAEAANLHAARTPDAASGAAAGGAADGDEVARLAVALAWWWLLRGRLHEGRRALEEVPATARDAAEARVLRNAFALLTGDRSGGGDCPEAAIADPVRRGRAVWLYAYGLFHAGEPGEAERTGERALALATAADDRWGVAAALALRAMTALLGGDLAAVERDGLRSAALFRKLGDRWGELQTVPPLAALAEVQGDYAEAARAQREGLGIASELGLETEVSARLSGLGRLALLERDWDRARELHGRALRLAAGQGHLYGEVHAEMGLALGDRRSGELDAAEARLQRIHAARVSSLAGRHLLHAELGFVAELRGEAALAAAHHGLGRELAAKLGEPRAMALSLEGLAGAAALAGDVEGARRAALLLGAADAARRGVSAPLPPAERGDVDRVTASATEVLGAAAFAEAFRQGAALTPGETARVAAQQAAAAGTSRPSACAEGCDEG
ncbi:NB-ARC domain-containing protein [Actinomadura sp. ATCC 31491]|uniref:NB-ARC domain-containing protein n=1 Tax=Actinomadura luzonensis TaxID=2805427 RepID=A0ABT0FKG6_9ACTN|nr:BTAD domain-containing putative transcriptional regulator [Actinomadura luzonensis]MCK2212744.1 NB-ARC domain-containing protein [Actinomadura luzonensis]